MPRPIVKYVIAIAVGLVLCFGVMALGGILTKTNSLGRLVVACDGFFVTGALYLGAVMLSFCERKGAFDGISFSTKTLFINHSISKTRFENRDSYQQYREDKEAKRAKTSFPYHLLVAGAIFMLVAIVLLIIYKQMLPK